MTAAEVVQVLIPVAVFSMAVGFIVGNALAKTSESESTTIYRVDGVTQEPRYNSRSEQR